MKSTFSTSWIKSKQPRKQHKFRANAPEHIRGNFLSAHLSKDLKKEYGTRSIRVRTGDVVRVMRGRFKGQEGKVDRVDIWDEKVFVTKIELNKREGAKVPAPLRPSNLMIMTLNVEDKKRMRKFKSEAKQ